MYCPACHAEYPADWKACPKDATTLLKSAQIGKYQIEGLLGVGGMGAVYRAVNPDIKGARVAIKVMNPAVAGAEATRERFKREAAAVAALRTSHVVKVYDFSAEPDGTLYLVMELLDGHPLRDEIQPAPHYMDLARVQMVMLGALKGLAAAHRVGIVHRDLKPENIYVADTDDGEVPKLLDFGIARVRSTDKNLTHTGSLMGTASYMATEQIAAGVAEIGPWSDVYAMGAILYEMLAGAPAFGGSTVTEVLQRVLKAEHVPLQSVRPGLPPAVYQLVARAMSPDPAQRPQNAEQLRQALQAAQLVAPGTQVPPPVKTRVDAALPSQISGGGDARNRSDVAVMETEGRDTPIPAAVAAYDSRPNVIPGYSAVQRHDASQPNLAPFVPGDAGASQPALQVAGTGPGIASGTGPVSDAIDRGSKKRSPLPFVLGGLGLAGAAAAAIVVASSSSSSSNDQPEQPPVVRADAGTPPPPVDAAEQVAEIDAAVAEPLPAFTAQMVHFEAGNHELGEDPRPNPNALARGRHDVAEFWIDQDELTLAAVRAALGSKTAGGLRGDAPSLPARNVSWDQATATCRALGKRLPTEYEWEVAARTTPREPGKAALCQACPRAKPALRATTHADCSADGLCDMLGGVIEWTADGGKDKVVRGASYTVSPAAGWQASIGFRAIVPPAADAEVGFRCAWSRDTPPAPDAAAKTGGRAASAAPAPRGKQPGCDADDLGQQARDAAARGAYAKALRTAERGLACAPDDAALRRIAVLAACRMKNQGAARRHLGRVRPKDRNLLRQICVSSGVPTE